MSKKIIRVISSEAELREWTRCASNFVYFVHNYGWTLDPKRGQVRFRLFPVQQGLGRSFQHHWANLVLKPRQMGITWLSAAYALWLCIFHPDKLVLIISMKMSLATRFLDRVKFMYLRLPEFLKCGVDNGNEAKGEIGIATIIEFSNGSRIESIPTSPEAGRSEGVSLLIVDEAGFVRWMDRIWAAAHPTLSQGGQAIVLSTANGIGNWFHQEVVRAIGGDSDFFLSRLYWHDHPHRDQAWYDSQLRNLGKMRCGQEHDCDFLSTGNPVFDMVALREIDEFLPDIQPISAQDGGNLVIFRAPDPRKDYVLGADTATGESHSYQAAVVLERETGLQVAEYRAKIGIERYAQVISNLANYYNGATTAVEMNNTGRAVLISLRGLPDFRGQLYWHVDPVTGEVKNEPGWDTTPRTKPIIIEELEVLIRSGESGIQSRRLLNECYTYIREGIKTHAAADYSDDLVMAAAIANHVARSPRRIADLPPAA